MTLSSTTRTASFAGNGSTTTFAYAFKIFADADLVVKIRSSAGVDTTKTLTTHYTVTGAGDSSGGNVVFGTAPASGETVLIERIVAITQSTDYISNDSFPASAHEDALDRLTMIAQQLDASFPSGVTASSAELNVTDGLTASTAELNILDGVTATAAELNITDGLTSTTAELNILDGVTANASEINLLDAIPAGSIIYGNSSGASARLASGTATQVLTVSANGTDIAWADSAGGSGSSAADEITEGDAAVNITTSSGNITIDAAANDTDIIFKGTDNSSDITMLTLDGSEAGAANFNSTVTATGFIGAVTGNASTATVLETARTIGGVSFNGSANINLPGVNIAGNQNTSGNASTATTADLATYVTASANNSTDETVYVTFVDGTSGTQGIETDSGLTYNPSSGVLTSTTFAGALSGNASTATTLATARTIGGTSFDGSANIAVALASTATTLANARTIGGVSFDGSANINLPGVNTSGSQDTSGNASTATLATSVTATANQTNDETVYVTFVDGTTGSQGIETSTNLSFNPSTGRLSATALSGTLSGGYISSDSIGEASLDIHNSPSGTNRFLGYTANGMEWAVPPDTTTNTTYSISAVDGDATDEEKIRLTDSGGNTDDLVLEAGTGLSIARSGDKITFTNTVSDTNTTELSSDSSPQLGGDLDMNSQFISSGILGIKNTGSQSEVRLYCEVSNAHYASIKAPAHSAFSGNITFTLPAGYGSNNQVLKSDGSGGLSWVSQTSDTNTTYSVSAVDGDNSDEEKLRLTDSGGSTDDVVLEAGTGLSIARSGDKITFTNTVTDTDNNTTYSVSAVDGDNSDEEKIRLTDSGGSTDDIVLEAGTGLSIARSGDKITFTNTVSDTDTNTTYSISCVDGDNSDEEKIRLTDSGGTTDDVVLEAGTGLSIARSGDKITITNTVSDTNTTYSIGDGGLTQVNFTTALSNKLAAIEASADVTDASNVDSAGAVMNSDLDGKGELLVGDGSGDPSALSVGTNNFVLTADSSEATGLKWASVSGIGGGETNQNAFSNVAVSGQTTVAADSSTDTLTLIAGSNLTLTTNATDDSVTIASTDTNTTYSVGDGGLTQNNFTDALKSKLDGIATSANAYVHPNHSGDVTSSADGATSIANNAVTTAKINADAVTGAKIADDAIDSEHYTDASIDTVHIADDQVTYAKIQNVSATNRILGRDSSGAGIIEEITPANLRAMINVADGANAYTHPNHSGDVTSSADGATTIANNAVTTAKINADAVTGAKIADDAINSEHYTDGSIDTAHIADDQVTYAKIQNVSATNRILGRDSSGAGIIEEITPASLRTMLNVADGATNTTDTNTTYAISCADGDNSDEEKIRLTDSGGTTDDVVLEAGTGLSIARSGDKITFTNTVADTTLTTEAVQDIVGAMVSSNTESGITVTYQDGDGTVDFSVGTLNQNTTGSAATLTTARTIGGVSFDGSANIDLPGVNSSGNQDTSGNSATATVLANARTIGGVSFNGSANIDLPGVNSSGNQDTSGTAALATAVTTTVNNSTNETVYPVFVDGVSGSQGIETDSGLTYNPNSGLLTVAELSATTLDIGGTNITSTAAELNLLDGVTATTAEINYLDGVTSSIQTQLNAAGGATNSVFYENDLTLATNTTLNKGAMCTGPLTVNSGVTITMGASGRLVIL